MIQLAYWWSNDPRQIIESILMSEKTPTQSNSSSCCIPSGIKALVSWSFTGVLAHNRTIQSSYFWLFFVPVAAKALKGLDQKLVFQIFDQSVVVHPHLPFNWLAFFFSALAFAIGTVLYFAFCPPVTRDFRTWVDYRDSGRGEWYILDQLIDLRQIPEKAVKELNGTVSFLTTGTTYSCAISDKAVATVFWVVRDLQNHRRICPLIFTFLAFLLGTVLIGFVIIENIRFVLSCLI
ncbi:MAG: hypothetical protein JNJ83_18885 [Verrucomicrobiaceae bacterium]|nr:hypothetical protein [Verrucomicrobiaceae bacterium]